MITVGVSSDGEGKHLRTLLPLQEFRQKSLDWEKQRLIYQQQVSSLEAQRKALAEQSEIIQVGLRHCGILGSKRTDFGEMEPPACDFLVLVCPPRIVLLSAAGVCSASACAPSVPPLHTT